MNRTRFILFLAIIPLTLFLSFSEPLLIMLGQDPQVSKVASHYIIFMIPSFFLFGLFDANRLFLNCMEISSVATTLLVASLPLHMFLCYFFVFILKIGVFGVCIAMTVTDLFLLGSISLYSSKTSLKKVRDAWVLPNRESFKEWREILEIGIPGVLMYMVEWSACEGLILMSGLIGVAELSTMGIILVLIPLLECFSFGMQFTITIYAGNAIGEGAVEKAYTFAKAGFAMVCYSTTLVAIMIILTRKNLILFFTEDPAVRTLYASAMIVLAI